MKKLPIDFSLSLDQKGQNESLSQAQGLFPILTDLDDNQALLQKHWSNCLDIQFRQLQSGGTQILLVWLKTLVGKELAQQGVLNPLTSHNAPIRTPQDLEQFLTAVYLQRLRNMDEINKAIADGYMVVLIEGANEAVAIDVTAWEGRPIEKPELEPGVLGPQESFTESLEKNLGLLRRRLRTSDLKMESIRLGTVTQAPVSIVYLQGVAKPELVDEVRLRLSRIQIDGTIDINYISEMTKDAIRSPYPTDQITERPDRAAAALLQARVAIILDGSPYALFVPALFVNFMNSSEDYYGNYTISVPVRLLRHSTFWASLLLPALYIALLSYHQEMLPTALLVRLAATHEGIPFPAVIEAFIMVITFEALREAGIRLPKAVGQSVSIVGALVIGDAAVNAGIVSPGMVIVVALTGVASFSIPSYNMALTNRILQFPFMILAGLFGLYGITIGLLILMTHLVSLRSFGMPYLYPLAPFDWKTIKGDVFARDAWWNMRQRPNAFGSINSNENATPRPQPPQGEPS